MVQVFDNPSLNFGQALMQGLRNSLPGGLAQLSQNMQEARQRKQASVEGRALAKMHGLGEDESEAFSRLSPETIRTMAPQLAKNLFSKKEENAIVQDSFNEMANILKKGNIGRGSGIKGFFGGETAKDAAYFNSLKASLIAAVRDRVNKGVLSNQKFQYIVNELLPQSTDLEDTIEGKLRGIAKELGLDASALGIEEGDQKEASQKPREKESSKEPIVRVKAPDGKIWRVPKNRVQAAIEAGGKVVK